LAWLWSVAKTKLRLSVIVAAVAAAAAARRAAVARRVVAVAAARRRAAVAVAAARLAAVVASIVVVAVVVAAAARPAVVVARHVAVAAVALLPRLLKPLLLLKLLRPLNQPSSLKFSDAQAIAADTQSLTGRRLPCCRWLVSEFVERLNLTAGFSLSSFLASMLAKNHGGVLAASGVAWPTLL
jgi:hypothetical protein